MSESKIKRGWEFDPAFIERFEQWIETVGMQKNAAAELGLWIVMRLPGDALLQCREAMTRGSSDMLLSLAAMTRDEEVLLADFRRLPAAARESILSHAREQVLQEEGGSTDGAPPKPHARNRGAAKRRLS
ncbi:MAG: hypothetical protein FWE88_00035 [Phycisphaerae bacterium]|nr:hypothetical protein [Phycisphaerae bacterium]